MRVGVLSSLGVLMAASSVAGKLRTPKLIVFDLDQCLWTPEMYTLDELPTSQSVVRGVLSESGELGVLGVRSGHETIRLFDDARLILQQYHAGLFSADTRIACASSADTPRAVEIGRAAMKILEIVPGVTMREVFAQGWPVGFEGNIQIGRTPPLSSNKAATHFPILRELTGIDYVDMVFFDDCNWGDHCGAVSAAHGVISQRTPRGLTRREFELCIRNWNSNKGGMGGEL